MTRKFVLIVLLFGVVAGCRTEYEAPPPQPVGSPPSLTDVPDVVEVELSDAQRSELGIEVHQLEASQEPIELTIPGEVVPSPDAFAIVSAPISGRIARITAHEGDRVRRGQVVAYIESLQFATLVAELLQANAQLELDRSTAERYAKLVDEGISPEARLLEANASLAKSEATRHASVAKLAALGVDMEATMALAKSDRPLLPVRAPVAGTIDRHQIDLGQAVTAYDELLTVVGTNEVLVRGMVSPDQATLIRSGDPASVFHASGMGRAVQSAVTSVSPAVDKELRAVVVNIRTVPQGLRPGQAVQIVIVTQERQQAVLLPISALTYDGDQAVVFVRKDILQYELRPIRVGPARTDHVPVLDGLVAGEEVAVSNVFDLKALARFEQYGEE